MDRSKFKRDAVLGVGGLSVGVAILALVSGDWTVMLVAVLYAVAMLGRYALWRRFPDKLHPANESTLRWLRNERTRRNGPDS
jgi:protein-S-isoprenylcysteine O-methyltransferase Ste14